MGHRSKIEVEDSDKYDRVYTTNDELYTNKNGFFDEGKLIAGHPQLFTRDETPGTPDRPQRPDAMWKKSNYREWKILKVWMSRMRQVTF